jgi:tol-pal system protein YbgF
MLPATAPKFTGETRRSSRAGLPVMSTSPFSPYIISRVSIFIIKHPGFVLLFGLAFLPLGCFILPNEAKQMSSDIYDIKLYVQRLHTLQSDSQKSLETSLQDLQQKSASNFDILNNNIIDLDQRIRSMEEEIASLRGRIEELKFQLSSQPSAAPPTAQVTYSPSVRADTVVTTQGAVIDGDLLLHNARREFDRGNYHQAIQQSQRFLSLFPTSLNAPSAQLLIGDSLYFQENYQQALLEFLRVKENYPADARVPEALQKVALCYIKLKQKEQATAVLQTIINQYPHYTDITRVEDMLNQLKEE